ncbi:MAG: T9SS type A sorting domain-containing protein [Bacteroidales bacterium]
MALEIQVDYSVFFWQQDEHQKYMILEYHIINKSGAPYSSLYAGFFADWVLRDNKNHRAAFDDQTRMGYAWSTTGGHLSGLQLLTEGNMRHYAFDQDGSGGSINIHDGFTGIEKYTALRTNRLTAGAFDQDNDVATLISSGPHYLEANDTLTVAFALLAGDHLVGLQESAQAAITKYRGVDDEITGVPGMDAQQFRLIRMYPNPAGELMTIEVNPPHEGSIEVMVTDLSGKILLSKVMHAAGGGQPASCVVDTGGLLPGQYVVTLKGVGFSGSRSFIRM